MRAPAVGERMVVKWGRDRRPYALLGGEWVRYYSRAEFLHQVWSYLPGEHVSVLGPTQISGKTRLLTDLLSVTDTSWCEVPPTMLITKRRDPTVSAAQQRLGYYVTREWPPRRGFLRRWFQPEPPGWLFWPAHLSGVPSTVNTAHLSPQFSRVLTDQHDRGHTLTVIDELYSVAVLYGLGDDVDRHLTQGQGQGSALWVATQKPSGTQGKGLSGFVFNSPTHTFIARDPVERNRKTYGDIGGVPTRITEHATGVMPKFNFLYIHRDGPQMCVVGAK